VNCDTKGHFGYKRPRDSTKILLGLRTPTHLYLHFHLLLFAKRSPPLYLKCTIEEGHKKGDVCIVARQSDTVYIQKRSNYTGARIWGQTSGSSYHSHLDNLEIRINNFFYSIHTYVELTLYRMYIIWFWKGGSLDAGRAQRLRAVRWWFSLLSAQLPGILHWATRKVCFLVQRTAGIGRFFVLLIPPWLAQAVQSLGRVP